MPPIKAEQVIVSAIASVGPEGLLTPREPHQEELYPSVMGEVIGASLVDFEDTGVSLSVLDELKSVS